MSNPWLKKNPYMSMWLSGANAVAGSMRGKATAQAKRQTSAAITDATRYIFSLWAGTLAASPAAKPARRRR